MKKLSIMAAAGFSLAAANALAADFAVSSTSIADGAPVPDKYAYCKPDDHGKTTTALNLSPELAWENAPAGTQSYAVIVVDPDVPADFSNANKSLHTISESAPRQNFYHWLLVDIPPSVSEIPEGKGSDSRVTGGPKPSDVKFGTPGQNDFSKMDSAGHTGYDGPCPPWNDARLHHYHFAVYALNVPSLGLAAGFHGQDAMGLIARHQLGKAELVGTYTTNAKK